MLDLTTSRLQTRALDHCTITVRIDANPLFRYKTHPIADYCPYI